jgi:hypothetical protein
MTQVLLERTQLEASCGEKWEQDPFLKEVMAALLEKPYASALQRVC